MRTDEERLFSHILTNFLEQSCEFGDDLSIGDEQLFCSFKVFWKQAPEYFDHPTLLGQFRVALTQRGFLSAAVGKHPRWLGLTLRNQSKKRPQKTERRLRHA